MQICGIGVPDLKCYVKYPTPSHIGILVILMYLLYYNNVNRLHDISVRGNIFVMYVSLILIFRWLQLIQLLRKLMLSQASAKPLASIL